MIGNKSFGEKRSPGKCLRRFMLRGALAACVLTVAIQLWRGHNGLAADVSITAPAHAAGADSPLMPTPPGFGVGVQALGHANPPQGGLCTPGTACYSDVWGYTRADGKLLALLFGAAGLYIYDVSNPSLPSQLGMIPGNETRRGDAEVNNGHAYVVYNAPGTSDPGLQIIDLEIDLEMEEFSAVPINTWFHLAHELIVADNTLYAVGARLNGQPVGAVFLDISNPTSPEWLGSFPEDIDPATANAFYIHDGAVRGDLFYAAAMSEANPFTDYDRGFLATIDVSNPAQPQVVRRFSWPHCNAHSCDITPDGNYLIATDEIRNCPYPANKVRIFDISNPFDVEQVAVFTAANAPAHTALIAGNLLHVSNYFDGLRVLDILNPRAPYEAGFYDTSDQSCASTGRGAYGSFPYTTTGDIYVGDTNNGLFVLRFSTGVVTGTVTDASTGMPLPSADVSIIGGPSTKPLNTGDYRLYMDNGLRTVVATAYGYQTASLPVSFSQGSPATANFALNPVPTSTISGTISMDTGGIVDNALVELDGKPHNDLSDVNGAYVLPNVPNGVYSLTVTGTAIEPRTQLVTVNGSSLTINVTTATPHAFDMFESQSGWVAGGNATEGGWVRVDPSPNGVGIVQPDDDHTLEGASCWVTGNMPDPGLPAGKHDVDFGEATLTSPVYSIGDLVDPRVSFWLWFFNGEDTSPSAEPFVVQLLDGSQNVFAEYPIPATTKGWKRFDLALRQFASQTNPIPDALHIRFIAQDHSSNGLALVEALVDDVCVYDACDGPGVINASSMTAWADEGNFPGQMKLHFKFTTTTPAREFGVKYRKQGQTTWQFKSCAVTGPDCLFFNPDGSYEAVVTWTPCEGARFQWRAYYLGCWSDTDSSWTATKTFQAYCLEPPGSAIDPDRPLDFDVTVVTLGLAEGALFNLSIPEPTPVDIRIYDVRGREVARVANETVAVGTRSYTWRTAAHRSRLASGVYFYKVQMGAVLRTGKLTIVH